ncbi:MAG: C25 family peptidase propeptide domain-containing protein [Moheibacter sp.]
MKKLFFTILLFAAVIAFAQVAYTFTVQTGDFKITTDQTYKVVTSAQTGNFTTQVGAPRLPVYTRSFVLPSGSTVTNINISNQGQVLLDGNANIYPAQPVVAFDSIPEFVPPDATIYNSGNPFPAETVILRSDAYTMGYRINEIRYFKKEQRAISSS